MLIENRENHERTAEIAKRQKLNALLLYTETGDGSCPLACSYCEPAGTRLLTWGGRWVPIETIQVGDTLVGFTKEDGERTRFTRAVVTGTAQRKAQVHKIKTDKGEVVATGDHLWLSDHNRWRRTDRFQPGQWLRWVADPIDPPDMESLEYRHGYLVGAAEGDGTLGHYHYENRQSVHQFRLAVKDKEILDRFEAFMDALWLPYRRRKSHTGSADEGVFVQGRHQVELVEKVLGAWVNHEQFYRGYLAGIFDAEGSYDGQLLRISNGDEKTLTRIATCMSTLGIDFIRQDQEGHVSMITMSNTPSAIRFIAATQPACTRKFEGRIWDHSLYGKATVQVVEPLGEETVYSVQTSAETYIAEGFASHNCFLAKQGEIKTMSLETLYRSIDFLMEYGTYRPQDENARRLHFFGTEPLKRWELVQAAAEYAPDLKITMTTNGYLMTEDKIQWLAAHPNVRVVIWSLDGDENHNSHRVTRAGKSSFDQIVKNLRRYAEVIGLEGVALRGTITPADMDLVSRFSFLKDLNPGSVEIVPDVTADWDEAEVAAMYRRLGEHYGWQRPPSNLLASILHAVQQPKKRTPGNQCGTGFFAWSVSPDGALSMCQGWEEYPHMRFGSVWEGVTTTLPFELVSWEVDKFHTEQNPYPKEGCKGCHAYDHCMGIGWCATEFYRARRNPERPWEDPIDMVTVPTDGYCAHLRGAVTAMEYWAAQQHREAHETNLLQLLMEEGKGWVTIDSESNGNRTLANS